MIDIDDQEAVGYVETKKAILEVLKNAKQPLTCRELKRKIKNDNYLADALSYLVFMGLIEEVGSLLISRYAYVGKTKVEPKTRHCASCQQERPLLDFNLEWSGQPSKRCKYCRSNAKRRNKHIAKAQGK